MHSIDAVHVEAHITEQVVELHGRIEFQFAVIDVEFGSRVKFHHQLSGVGLCAAGHFHGVSAGQNARTLGSFKRRSGGGRNARRFEAHRPLDTADAATAIGGQRIHHLALSIRDFEFHFSKNVAFALIVGNQRGVRRVRSGECGASLGPTAVGLKPLLSGLGLQEDGVLLHDVGRKFAQRADVVNDPNATAVRCENQIGLAWMDDDIANRDGGQFVSFVLRPVAAAIQRDPQSEFSSQIQNVGIDWIFFDDMGVATNTAALRYDRRPGFSGIGGFKNVRVHVTESVTVERSVGGVGVMDAGFHRRDPGEFRQIRNITDDVGPGFSGIGGQLKISIVGARPDDFSIARRFADGINGGVGFGVGVVNGDAARLFLLLFFGIVGGEVGRDALPRLAVVARTKKKLRSDIQRALFTGTHVNRSIPVEAELAFAVVGLRLNRAGFQRETIHAADFTALGFGVDVVGIGRIGKYPKAVAAEQVFPAAVSDTAGILRIANPDAVVLQTAENVIRICVVGADVVELRNRQIGALPPTAAAVIGIPDTTVIPSDQVIGVFGIDPDVVKITVRAAADGAETFAAVFAHDQRQ